LNCSPAPHHFLTGGESQEDQEADGSVVFSKTYISPHKRPGQRLTITKDGERNGPLLTTRSDDDDD